MTAMPPGAYVSIIGSIRAGAGGQTRVLLLRHRLFAEHLGIDVPILTYNPTPDYHRIRASLHADGLLLPDSRVLNMHEDLRHRDLRGHPPSAAAPRPPAVPDQEKNDREGRPWLRRMIPSGAGPQWLEYVRPDGSVYARTPADKGAGAAEVCGPAGEVIGSWPTLGGLWRWWTQLVTPASGHVFVLSDSRFVSREIAQIDDPRFFVLHQMHNPHTVGRRHWTSSVSATYVDAMEHTGRLDALSCLTSRQRDDVAMRFGRTDNLVVVPNPAELPSPPEPPPAREAGRIVMIARLHSQKRLDRAIEAFGILAASRPAVRLDIYGDGPERAALQQQIDEAGLTGRVVLHGHQPDAADQFWAADVCWLTSAFEGYALVLLEARVRGCPPVSFDVPYGPREQITEGVDGCLVPAGDVRALARATADLLGDRAALEAMRPAAQQSATRNGPQRFLDDWAAVVAGAIERKPHLTRIDAVDVRDLHLGLPGRRHPGRLTLAARVEIRGAGDLGDARVSWQAYNTDSAEPIELPLEVDLVGGVRVLRGEAPAGVIDDLRAAGRVTLRLLIVCRNSAWRHELHEGPLGPAGGGPAAGLRRVVGVLRRRTRP